MQPFLDTVSHIGSRVLVAAITVLVLDLAAMITYTIRNGSKEKEANQSVGPKDSVLLDNPRRRSGTEQIVARKYRSKTKILGQASGFITDDSLIDGTATFGQRMMVRGIRLWFACLWLIMVSAGMSAVSRNILGIWLIVGPTVWFAWSCACGNTTTRRLKTECRKEERLENLHTPSPQNHRSTCHFEGRSRRIAVRDFDFRYENPGRREVDPSL